MASVGAATNPARRNEQMSIARRGFLNGLLGAIAAPTVARASNLMKLPYVRSGLHPVTDRTVVDIANQTGCALTISSAHQSFAVGSIITIDDVFAVHRLDGRKLPNLRQFVVTALVSKGDRRISIYPPLIPAPDPYQTVDKSPASFAKVEEFSPSYFFNYQTQGEWSVGLVDSHNEWIF